MRTSEARENPAAVILKCKRMSRRMGGTEDHAQQMFLRILELECRIEFVDLRLVFLDACDKLSPKTVIDGKKVRRDALAYCVPSKKVDDEGKEYHFIDLADRQATADFSRFREARIETKRLRYASYFSRWPIGDFPMIL